MVAIQFRGGDGNILNWFVRFWPESAIGVLQSYVRFGEAA